MTPRQRDTIERLKAEYVIPADAAKAFDEAGNVVFLNNQRAIVVHPDGGVSGSQVR